MVLGESPPAGLDGRSWRVLITDGARSGEVEVGVSGTQASMAETLSEVAIAAAVERRAGEYDRERDRYAQLIERGSLQLRADELRP